MQKRAKGECEGEGEGEGEKAERKAQTAVPGGEAKKDRFVDATFLRLSGSGLGRPAVREVLKKRDRETTRGLLGR